MVVVADISNNNGILKNDAIILDQKGKKLQNWCSMCVQGCVIACDIKDCDLDVTFQAAFQGRDMVSSDHIEQVLQ